MPVTPRTGSPYSPSVIRRACVVALAAASLLLGGCSSSDPAKTEVELRPRWQETTLPTPPGPPGRLAVRDATATASGC
jgi:hypothetical protein